MATSQNGWPVITDDTYLHAWVIPFNAATLRLRRGSAGFVLAHFALWFDEMVEPLKQPVLDDWGYAYRPIAGTTTGFSNHASGTAMDLNATQHPLGAVDTFTKVQANAIRARLAAYDDVVRWGGDYATRKDEMHFEINRSFTATARLARNLMDTPRGLRILNANPGQKAVILA